MTPERGYVVAAIVSIKGGRTSPRTRMEERIVGFLRVLELAIRAHMTLEYSWDRRIYASPGMKH